MWSIIPGYRKRQQSMIALDGATIAAIRDARLRILTGSQKMVAELALDIDEFDRSNVMRVSQSILEVLSGVGDLAMYGDSAEEFRVEAIRKQLAGWASLMMGMEPSLAYIYGKKALVAAGFANALGVRTVQSRTDVETELDLEFNKIS